MPMARLTRGSGRTVSRTGGTESPNAIAYLPGGKILEGATTTDTKDGISGVLFELDRYIAPTSIPTPKITWANPGRHHSRNAPEHDAARRDGLGRGYIHIQSPGGDRTRRGQQPDTLGDIHANRHDRLHHGDRHRADQRQFADAHPDPDTDAHAHSDAHPDTDADAHAHPTPTPGLSSFPRFSTAEKQAFLNLATAEDLRAVRLAVLATVAPALLTAPLDELAAYYFDESQDFAAIADDPPDSNFTTVAAAQPVSAPPIGAGGGITQAEANQFNALFAEEAQALGLANAISTALNRAQGAGDNPANAAAAQMQLAAVTQDSQQLGALVATEPGLLAGVQTAVQQSGVADVSVSPSAVAGLQQMVAGAGLPAALVQALLQLQTSSAQLQAIQTQFVQTNPIAAAGSLAGTLTDPAYTASSRHLRRP